MLACLHTALPPLGEAAPSPIFPERRGSVHRLLRRRPSANGIIEIPIIELDDNFILGTRARGRSSRSIMGSNQRLIIFFACVRVLAIALKYTYQLRGVNRGLLRGMVSTLHMRTTISSRQWGNLDPSAYVIYWAVGLCHADEVLMRTKQLSITATSGVIWLCECLRYSLYRRVSRGVGTCASVLMIGIEKRVTINDLTENCAWRHPGYDNLE